MSNIRKKIGLALGSGGARGFCHIGVLQVFEKYNIPIDYISGCSMGALVAGCYSSGVSPEELIEVSTGISQLSVMDLGFSPKRNGLLKGEKAMDIVNRLINDKSFEETNIPLAVTATNLRTGKLVTFTKGKIIPAIRASMSIPVVFQTAKYDEEDMLADGGLVERIPISVCREMGADVVIAVDAIGPVTDNFETKGIKAIADLIERSYVILDWESTKEKLKQADLVITPDQEDRHQYSFKNNDYSIEQGRIAAESAIDRILELIK